MLFKIFPFFFCSVLLFLFHSSHTYFVETITIIMIDYHISKKKKMMDQNVEDQKKKREKKKREGKH